MRRARTSFQFARTSWVTCSRADTPPPSTGTWPLRWQPRQSTGCVSSSTPAPPETVSGHWYQCWSRSNCQGTGTVHAEEPSTATLLGMRTRTYMFQPVAQIKLETDFQYRWVCGVYTLHIPASLSSCDIQETFRPSVVDEDTLHPRHPLPARLHLPGGGSGPGVPHGRRDSRLGGRRH